MEINVCKNGFKRALAVFMALLIVMSSMWTGLGAVSFAVDENEVTEHSGTVVKSGHCGSGVEYELDAEGNLRIFGNGSTHSYTAADTPFFANNNIKNVVIEEGVTDIGYGLFYACASIMNVTIPVSMTYVADAFKNCTSLTNVYYSGSENQWNEIEIDTLEGGNDYFVDATIHFNSTGAPERTVVKSGQCGENVNYVLYDDGELVISGTGDMWDYDGDSPFLWNDVKTVVIENGVTRIGAEVFFNCFSLASVAIPDSVTTIGENAFYDCTGLVSITVDENNQYYSFDEYGVLFNKDKTSLVQYPTGNERASYIIPDSVRTIGNFAFCGCRGLSSITIPDSVTTIGNYAFCGCRGLSSITIPDSVTTIGSDAFNYCIGLTSVTIGDSVTTIGNYAFDGCAGLTEVTIGDSVTTIGDSAFNHCTGLTSVTIGDSVTTIDCGAFYDCAGLTSVTIPDSVITIGNSAFQSCTSLTDVYYAGNEAQWNGITIGGYNECLTDATIHFNSTGAPNKTVVDSGSCGENVNYVLYDDGELVISGNGTIGVYAFENETSIKSLVIEEGVKVIEGDAFSGCVNLESIIIPDSIERIEAYAFYNTAYLNNESNWEDGALYIGKHLIQVDSDVSDSFTIKPDTITIAGNAIRECDNLTSVIIPDSVKTIGAYAFYDCANLANITISDSVINVQDRAFEGTAYYDNYSNWQDGVLYIGNYLITASENISGSYAIKPDTKVIARFAFFDCASLEEVTIPDSVTNIGFGAFQYCESITSITIPDGITEIPAQAFLSCTSLESITIPDSVISIGFNAFDTCSALADVYYAGTENQWNAINTGVSNDCLFDAEIHFNSTGAPERTVIESGSCGDNVTYVLYDDGELVISGTGDMWDYDWSEGPTSPLYENEQIKTVVIENGVTRIGNDAFFLCGNLTSVIIPDSVTTIGRYTFCSCDSLASVNIPDNVTTIERSAFQNCVSLTSITIPDSVTTIEWYAFQECFNLTDVYYAGSEAQWDAIYIDEDGNDCLTSANIHFNSTGAPERTVVESGSCGENVTYVLYDDGELVISGEGPMQFNNSAAESPFYNNENIIQVYVEEGITHISDFAFYGCTNLSGLVVSYTVTSMGTDVLYNTAIYNNDLSWDGDALFIGDFLMNTKEDISGTYNIPEGTRVIAASAFQNRTQLQGVTIPTSVENIGGYAFCGCTGITSVIIPESVRVLEFGVFCLCENLASVTIPDSVTTIRYDSFSQCYSLADVYYGGSESQWNEADISDEDGYLTGATIHFGSGSGNVTDGNVTGDMNISAGETKTVYVDGETVYLKFVPEYSGRYTFTSDSYDDTYGYLFDEYKNEITHNDDGGYDSNFLITYDLQAGVTYYWGANFWSGGSGSYEVTLTCDEIFCVHENTTNHEAVEATCAQSGYTAGVFCEDCSEWISGHEIVIISHTDADFDNVCDVCGGNANDIAPGQTVTVNVGEGETVYLRFSPQASGRYRFVSNADVDTYGYIYDENKNVLASNDDGAGDGDFSVEYDLYAGVTYYLGARYYSSSNSGSFDVTLYIDEVFCSHENTEPIQAIAPTCTESGFTAGERCLDCGEIVVAPEEVLPRHTDADADNYCDLCSEKISDIIPGETKEITVAEGEMQYFKFVPRVSGEYGIDVDSTGLDTWVAVYNKYDEQITGTWGDNFTFELQGGETYRIGARYYDYGESSSPYFNITLYASSVDCDHSDKVSYPQQDATCTQNGYTAGVFCTHCGLWIEGHDVISGLHTYVDDDFVCDVCNETPEVVTSGNCGESVEYYILSDETVFIKGAGEMYSYDEDWDDWSLSPRDGWEDDEDDYRISPFYENRNIRQVKICDGVTGIGNYAFYGCTDLVRAVIPDSITYFGSCSFYLCKSLESIRIPERVIYLYDYTFSHCESLTEVTVPDSVTLCGYGVFYGCTKLSKIKIGKGLAFITYDAFSYCNAISEITIDEENPFYTIDDKGVLYNKGKTQIVLALIKASIGDYVIPDTVTEIGYRAFYECAGLESVTIPGSVETIESYVFAYCNNLKSVTLSEGLKRIDYEAFEGCDSLESIVIPDSVIEILGDAFYSCDSLASITLPDNLVSLGDSAFSRTAYYYNEDNWDNDLLYIGNYLVCSRENEDRSSYEVKDGVTLIADGVFEWNYYLEEIALPESLKYIGDSAFYDCENLTDVYYRGSEEEWKQITIDNYNEKLINARIWYNRASSACAHTNTTSHPAVESTCSAPGYTAGVYCNDCQGWTEGYVSTGFLPHTDADFNNVCDVCSQTISEILVGEQTDVTGAYENEVYFRFVPTVTGKYRLSAKTNYDEYRLSINDENKKVIGDTWNQDFSYNLTSGNLYYWGAKYYNYWDDEEGRYFKLTLHADEVDCAHEECTSFEEVAATCTENGYTAGKRCNSCGLWLEGHEKINASHADANDDFICDNCGVQYEIKETGSIGDNATYYILADGTAKIIGTGATYNFDWETSPFSERSDVTKVVISQGITSLGYGIFDSSYNLESVVLPESLTSIESRAFSYCNNLESIVIPDGVTYIGSYAFEYCDNLTDIIIPESVTVIENGAFRECESLKEITLPSGLEYIDSNMFSYCYSLETIVIPESVTEIGYNAFYCCEDLKNITIPDSVTYIRDHAFYACHSLGSVVIPDSVKTLGEYVFQNCKNLKTVSIGKGLESIGEGAFIYCSNLESITVDEENAYFTVDEYGVLYNKDKTKLIACPAGNGITAYSVPDTVTEIEERAFESCSALSDITVPDTVTRIGYRAFHDTAYYNNSNNYDNSLLYAGNHLVGADDENESSEIYIREGTLTIADGVFNDNYYAKKIVIPDSVRSIGEEAFYSCDSLTEVVIGRGVREIRDRAFAYCYDLENVIIPASVETIGAEAFYCCSSLKQVTIEKGVKNIYSGSFESCYELRDIYYTGSQEDWNGINIDGWNDTLYNADIHFNCASPYCEHINKTVYEESAPTCTTDGYSSGVYCNDCNGWVELSRVILANHVDQNDDDICDVCGNRADVVDYGNCGENVKFYLYSDGTLEIFGEGEIASDAFSYKDNICNVTIGEGVTAIGDYVFCNSTVESVTMPSTITRIGERAFAYSNISGIIIPSGTTEIGRDAFFGCHALTSIEIPDSVTSLGAQAFCDCSALESVTIGNGITSIDYSTFAYCRSLKNVVIPEGVTSICENAFEGCTSLEEAEISGTVSEIAYRAFFNCSSLKGAELPASVESIGDEAFARTESAGKFTVDENNYCYTSDESGVIYNAEKTVLVQYPAANSNTSYAVAEGVELIKSRAFELSGNLKEIILPSTLKTIEHYAFSGCSGLESIIIPNGITNIDVYTFYECTSLKTVTIPESVTHIGYRAFGNCESITDVYYFGSEEQWNEIEISDRNGYLTDATIHFNCCSHENSESSAQIDATCTTDGYTAGVYCNDCAKWISGHELIPASHTDTDGDFICEVCGLSAATVVKTGMCGDNATYTLYSDGRLEIIGSGETYDYYDDSPFMYEEGIKHILIGDGITSIGGDLFYGCGNVEDIIIADSLAKVGAYAFYQCDSLRDVYFTGSEAQWNEITIGEENTCLTNANLHFDYVPGTCMHKNTQVHEAVNTTCTSSGYTEGVYCSDCETWISGREYIPAPGHDYVGTVTEPGCTTEGYTTFTCSACDDSYVANEVPATGHTEVTDAAVAPTCTETGLTEGMHCSECDEVLVAQQSVDALGHDIVTDAAVAPTCTETGLTEGSHCSRCDAETVAQEVVPATGHTEVTDAAVAPTCTETGLTEGSHCSVCNAVIVEQEAVPATGHTEVTDEAKDPTCEETGLTEGSHCSVCNTVIVAQEVIPATGHTVEITDAEEPTCTEKGYTEGAYCTECEKWIIVREEIPAKGHTEEIDAEKAPTCTEDGLTEGKHCSVCDEELVAQEVIPATGHTEEMVAAKAATCTEAGHSEGKRCSVCQQWLESVVEIPAKGHSEEILDAVEPTCTKKGKTEGKKCSECDEVLVAQQDIPAKGHTEVIIEATEATCTETGLTEGSYCSVCGKDIVEQEVVPAKGHTEVIDQAKAATCTKTGLTQGKHCSVCDEVLVEQEVVPKTSHKSVTVKGKAATCTETGLSSGKKCSVCGKVTVAQKEIPAKGHKEVTVKAKAATCTKSGLTAGKKCSTCGKITVAQKKVPAKGHTEVTVKAKAATCKATGLTAGKKCSVCGKVTVKQKTVAKKAHTYKNIVTKATLTKNGKITKKCKVCGYTASKSTTVYSPKTFKLSTYTYTYNGKVKAPVVTVKDAKGNTLKRDVDYTVKYASGRKMPGKYSVVITFKGKYSGKKTLTFKINPAAPKLTKVTSTKKGVASLNWSNVTGETGYEVYFSTKKSSGFKKLGTYKVNVVKATKSKLTSKKTYYFKVRAYKQTASGNVYSAWSPVKSVKIK